MKQRSTLRINEKGRLEIGGCDSVELVGKYGTPLYVMDKAHIVNMCRGFTELLKSQYPNSLVCYASKAFSCKGIYQLVSLLGLGADVVSGGELYTALQGGANPDNLYFHGNNKTEREITEAVQSGVHAIVCDSMSEIDLIDEIAKKNQAVQGVMFRVNPGIDAHTHKFIQTTRVDSKFGFSIADGTATEAIKKALSKSNLKFLGVHCHIGSQILELKPFALAVEKMTDFIKQLNDDNIEVLELNLGGGYGIPYLPSDVAIPPVEYVKTIVEKLKECVSKKKIKAPRLILEPGRSIVAEAGVTLYTVGAVKEIKDVKKYVSVDGGMFENPRYALYESEYEAVLASNMLLENTQKVTVAGKCCESGDMLVVDTYLPDVKRGDVLAILSTGAYNYSMASRYNRNTVPPVVIVENGKSEYLVRGEEYRDLVDKDEIPDLVKGVSIV